MKSLTILGAALSLACMGFSQIADAHMLPQKRQAPISNVIHIKVCNESGREASVAVSYVQVGESTFMNRGWYTVRNGECKYIVDTDNANFYLYADAMDGSNRQWRGNHTLCVAYPGPYTFYTSSSSYCESNQQTRDFTHFNTRDPGDWTWTLNP